MSDDTYHVVQRALSAISSELIDGAAKEPCWVLNPEDPGLIRSLDKLPAAAASAIAPSGGSSIAAHIDHLRYGLELLNRWSRGEDPFGSADYSASWRRSTVSNEEWTTLRQQLRAEAQTWLTVIREPRNLSEFELTGIVASVAHLAYHLGAIRQLDRTIRGPEARD